jgi:hypothetical protein
VGDALDAGSEVIFRLSRLSRYRSCRGRAVVQHPQLILHSEENA